jgi:hypothetical protein
MAARMGQVNRHPYAAGRYHEAGRLQAEDPPVTRYHLGAGDPQRRTHHDVTGPVALVVDP